MVADTKIWEIVSCKFYLGECNPGQCTSFEPNAFPSAYCIRFGGCTFFVIGFKNMKYIPIGICKIWNETIGSRAVEICFDLLSIAIDCDQFRFAAFRPERECFRDFETSFGIRSFREPCRWLKWQCNQVQIWIVRRQSILKVMQWQFWRKIYTWRSLVTVTDSREVLPARPGYRIEFFAEISGCVFCILNSLMHCIWGIFGAFLEGRNAIHEIENCLKRLIWRLLEHSKRLFQAIIRAKLL